MASKYLSLTDFATFRGVTPTSETTPTDTQVQEYIEIAETEFDVIYGDISEKTGISEVTRGRAFQIGSGVYLSVSNVAEVSGVEVSNGDDFSPVYTFVDAEDYFLDNGVTGKVRIKTTILKRPYRVTFNSGYALIDVPKNLKYLVYLLTMRLIFQNHLFDNNISDNVTRIVDVEVYREITKGGNAFQGLQTMDVIINEYLASLKGGLRTYIGW